MEKSFVVCHMFVSMDGKIDGAFMGCEAAGPARAEYARLRGEYACDAVVYGTVTMAQGFSDGLAGKLRGSGRPGGHFGLGFRLYGAGGPPPGPRH